MAAPLSSYGGFLIGPATVITVDFIKEFYKKDMSERQEANLIRVFIGVGAVITCLMAQTLPTIVNMFTWIYSFTIPVFFLFVFGLWWKRNKKVGILAFTASWLIANIWTFFPEVPEALHMGNVHISYVIVAVSLVILVACNWVSTGKPGYFRSEEWRQSQAYRIYLEEKAKGNA